MGDSDSDDNVEAGVETGGNVEDLDTQMAFVLLLEDFKVLLDKRQTPAIKAEKDKAAASLAEAYGKNAKKILTAKQVMKKLNNMKTKVKDATDLKKTGNKKIVLTEWQKTLYSLWNDRETQGENPVLNRVPGAVTSGYASTSTSAISIPPPEKKRKLEIKEPEEFEEYSLQQLQRKCLIQEIQAARAQESAANEMKEFYKFQNSQRNNSVVLYSGNIEDIRLN